MNILVCIKQVPDTTIIKIDPETNTLMREGVPAIVSPFDAYALEAAARIKDKDKDTKIVVLSMGPEQALAALKECLSVGGDKAYLVSDRACGGSDTLATSYALACALRNLQTDLLICGRQAIDGDTAQVGPQVAEKLGLPQVTYAEDILDITAGKITIKRRLERGIEVVECPVPCVVTVNGSAAPCRPRNARYVMKYKYARATQEMQDADEDYLNLLQERPYLKITEWSVNDITCEAQELGLSGSPTKVKNIESVVFQAKEAKVLEPSDTAIDEMMKELIVNHTVG